MSKIWICQSKTADIPFVLEEQNIKLYSFEELCCYLYQSTENIEESFFDERLLTWLEKELYMTRLCTQLRQGLEEGKILSGVSESFSGKADIIRRKK